MNTFNNTPMLCPARPSFKHLFSLGGAQALVVGCFDYDLSERNLADVMRPQLSDPESTLSVILNRNRLQKVASKLLKRLELLTDEEDVACRHFLAAVTALHPSELFLDGDLPSVHVLRRFGLAAPVGRRIWGLVTLQLANFAHYEQLVLQHEPAVLSPATKEQLGRELMSKFHELRNGPASSRDPMLRLCYDLAVVAGSRFHRVIEEDGGSVRVEPIPIEALRSDVEDGSLRGLVIPGVNAPPSEAS